MSVSPLLHYIIIALIVARRRFASFSNNGGKAANAGGAVTAKSFGQNANKRRSRLIDARQQEVSPGGNQYAL